MILSAIDIGSNAARLLIAEAKPYAADGTVDFTKQNFLRVPLRLGFDVFRTGRIGAEKEEQLVETMKAYKILMGIYRSEGLKACATSAMRDAANGPEIMDRVKQETGIAIRIIGGQEEASILYETHIAETLQEGKSYIYIDVGGGSTEVTMFAKGITIFKESFNIGTVRLLAGKVEDATWERMKLFIKTNVRAYGVVEAIGSGGNINKVFSLSKIKTGRPLPLELLRDYHREMSVLTNGERAHLYQLREDRADVIVPALQIYISIMRWAGAEEIYVPQIGLADGLVKMLYAERSLLVVPPPAGPPPAPPKGE